MSTVGVIGAGAWGTAMAKSLAQGDNKVQIWAFEQDVVDEINNKHSNRFLPGFTFPESLTASTDIKEVASGKDFIILASPSLFLAKTIANVVDVPDIKNGKSCIGILTKGFIPSTGEPKLIVETLEEVLPPCYKKSLVYIAGPSHAEEVAMNKITGLIAASENPMNSIRFRELLKGRGLMVYSSLDVIGVQVCAAAKNVVAVAYGILDALAENSTVFGDNTESLLLAAGLNEIQTIGRALGATHEETFVSISGVGDLDVTCRSKYGRNRRFGHDIINKNIIKDFKNIDDLISRIGEIGYLPEGAVACKYIHEIAIKHNLKLPVCSALYKILNKEEAPDAAIDSLLGGMNSLSR